MYFFGDFFFLPPNFSSLESAGIVDAFCSVCVGD